MVTIGILSLQGDIRFHESILDKLFVMCNINKGKIKKIKKPEDINGIDGLIIPGGESTVIGALAKKVGLFEILKEKIQNGLPTLGSCAGLIFLAKEVYDKTVGKKHQPILGVLNIVSERNSFGTQKQSFEADLSIPILGEKPFKGIFIRAPTIKSTGADVEILSKFDEKIVAIKQNNIIGISFHPELTEDLRIHKFFLDLILK